MTTTMTRTEISTRIAELEATDRALVGSDEGTHGKPLNHRIYETITGERYAVASFAGANGTRCTEAEARANTKGRVRDFPHATEDIRAAQKELRELRKLLRATK